MHYVDNATWNGTSETDGQSWQVTIVVPTVQSYLDPLSWNGTFFVDNLTSWGLVSTTDVPVVTSDVLLVSIAEAPTESRLTFTDDPLLTTLGEIGYPPMPIEKVGTDTLIPVFSESWILVKSDNYLPVAGSDVLLVGLLEAPITARLISTDDPLLPTFSPEFAHPPAPDIKTATDTLLVVLGEAWTKAEIGEIVKTGSDTLLVGLSDIAQFPVPIIIWKVASDELTVGITDVTQALYPIIDVRSSDGILVAITEDHLPLSTIDFFTEKGLLPPGWGKQYVTELAGIARPWRNEPHNVTPTQGWMQRKYWAVYDDKGNLRVTDRWEEVAHARAWTEYQAGKQSAPT